MSKQIQNRLQEYWNHRAPTYNVPDVFGRMALQAYITKLQPKSLLEVGCGAGELFPLYKDIPDVEGLDWSDNMLGRSRKRIERHGFNITLHKKDITREHLNRKFDVALTRTVLMHIHPSQVESACKNIAAMSDQLLIFEFYDPVGNRKLAWHNWHHNYPELFKGLGYRLVEFYDRPDGLPQILFYFKR